MTLYEIIRSNHWLSVELTLLKIYPDQKESIEAYKECYANLNNMPVEESRIEIIIEQEYDEEIEDMGIGNVYGIDNKDSNAVALGFTPWSQWLGMTINEHTQKEFMELEIIAYCLYEMTFYGFNEEDIQNEIINIEGIIEDYKKDRNEEE